MFPDLGRSRGRSAIADQTSYAGIDAVGTAGRIAACMRDDGQTQPERICPPRHRKVDFDVVDKVPASGFGEAGILSRVVPAGAQFCGHVPGLTALKRADIVMGYVHRVQSCRNTWRHISGKKP